MRIALRAGRRPAHAGRLALAGFLLMASTGRAASTPVEKTLPASTLLLIKVDNAAALRESVRQSQLGQLVADPAMAPLKADFLAKMGDADKSTKEKLGITLKQLLELPEGQLAIAAMAKDDPKIPFSIAIVADAGKNASTMQEVMTKATKEMEADKAKVTSESYQGLKLTVVKSTKDEDKDDPPLIWTSRDGIYYASSDMAALKDLLGHSKGRDDSLGASAAYQATSKKLGKDSQIAAYLDVVGVMKLVSQGANAQGGNAQQFEAILQITGLNNVKALGGSLAFNVGEFDRLGKLFLYSPGPSQGIQKVFQMPKAALKPPAWVPATAASYQSISWDLDNAYAAIDDLANMFAPGALNGVQQQLAGPDGNGLRFKEDLFGPLGDRVTAISDFKKPITEKSQRALIGVALEDPKAFQDTLNKIFAMAKVTPKKRDFQGTTIFDVEVPKDLGQNGMKIDVDGPISITVAKDTLFIATEPTLLEQVLRSGGSSLAESPAYLAVAKQLPATSSTQTYQKPDEQARLLYDLIKGGNLDKAVAAAGAKAQAAGGKAPNLKELIDPAKIPDFSVFAKYLSPGGGFTIQDEEGVTSTNFSLKKRNEP